MVEGPVVERGVLTASGPVRVEIPGKVASHLTDRPDLGEAEQHALRRGRSVRRGQGYSQHVTALSGVHHALLAAAAAPQQYLR